ncbi:MAG: chromate transporter [Rikenellaceae bacterium]|nr:chromate transporter [Rikenellaceae bacterium]
MCYLRPVKAYFELFWSFFKIGCFTFGGGYAMIPLIRREVIERRKWVGPDEFLELLALAQTSPGPIAINTSVFVGYKRFGWRGAFTATLGTVLPSFLIILAIAVFFTDVRDNPIVGRIFKGMRPAVVALIASPVYKLAKGLGYIRIGIAAAVAVAVGFSGVSPVWLLIAGAACGMLYGVYKEKA